MPVRFVAVVAPARRDPGPPAPQWAVFALVWSFLALAAVWALWPLPADAEVEVASAAVNAHPPDPGAPARLTVTFTTTQVLEAGDSITLEVLDTLTVPRTISTRDVSILGFGTASRSGPDNTGPPLRLHAELDSIRIGANKPRERHRITLEIPDMSGNDREGHVDGLGPGAVTISFWQGAGIVNRTAAGKDDWFVATTTEPDLVRIPPERVYEVPVLVELSEYHVFRGDRIALTGLGYEQGTTVNFWRDSDGDGELDSGEAVLCSVIASRVNRATCTFTLTIPPFSGGAGVPGDWNYINAVDGHGHFSTVDVPRIHVEPHLVVTLDEGGIGDPIHAVVSELDQGDRLSRIELARHPLCDESYDGDGDGTPDLPCRRFVESDRTEAGTGRTVAFTFRIPSRYLDGRPVSTGIQELRVIMRPWDEHGHDKDLEANIHVTPGQLRVIPQGPVLPNQRVIVSGSGFHTSSGRDGDLPAFIGPPPKGARHGCPGGFVGRVALAGEDIPWERVNGGRPAEVSSGGGWDIPLDLPVNGVTTGGGTHRLRVTDCRGGVGSAEITFPRRELSVTPRESIPGSEVVVEGRNFPAENTNSGSRILVHVEYDAGSHRHEVDSRPDPLGNFAVVLKVPQDDEIRMSNTIRAWFVDDDGVMVTETFTHRISQGEITLSSGSGEEGSSLVITGEGFPRYAAVDVVEFGTREITPIPRPVTDGSGRVAFTTRIPASDPGINIIRVEVAGVTATQAFTVVDGRAAGGVAVEVVFYSLIEEGALDRVFRFDNATKGWSWYIHDRDFQPANNLPSLSSGDLVWIRVSRTIAINVLGKPVSLTCVAKDAAGENCWNLVRIP